MFISCRQQSVKNRTVEWNYQKSYLDKLHLLTEDEEPPVPAVAQQEVAGVVNEKAARLVDLIVLSKRSTPFSLKIEQKE